MKKILLVSLVLLLIFGGVGCSNGESPEQAVKNALDAVKASDMAKASKYMNYTELTDDLKLNEKDEAKTASDAMAKLIFKKLSYTITSATKEGDSATVKAEITNTDMSLVFAEYVKQVLSLAFSGLDQTKMNDKALEVFTDLMSKDGNQTVTNSVEIKLTKNQNSWKINSNEDLANALSGGLVRTVETMSKSFTDGTTPDATQAAQTVEPTASPDGSEAASAKLQDLNSWLVGDIWNTGFCDIAAYINTGLSSTGQTLDVDFTLTQLDTALAKKADYDSFMNSLDNAKYSELKSIWPKLSTEMDVLHQQILDVKPVANDADHALDTGKFQQYLNAFSNAMYALDN